MGSTKREPVEPAIEPQLAIVDAQHHLWDRRTQRYLLPELLEDLGGGHNVVGTVYVEGSGSLFIPSDDAGVMYRRDAGEFAPLGEVEFANGVGAMAASGRYGPCKACAGIVGFAELLLGSRIRPVLEAQKRVRRFRGVRYHVGWHRDASLRNPDLNTREGLLLDPKLREALAEIEDLDLTFESAVIFTQLPEFIDLAKRNPTLRTILNHQGSPMLAGIYAGKFDEVFPQWRRWMKELAELPNVAVKLGALGKPSIGLLPDVLSSTDLAASWRPFIETTIELFGPGRCMFETNFPPDGAWVPYTMVWNAFKKIVSAYSDDEKHLLFFQTANSVYRLGLSATQAGAKPTRGAGSRDR